MPISRVSLARLSLLASLCLQLVIGLASPARANASVTVVSSDAQPNFPESISFELAAEIDGEVELIDLVYLQASLETYQLLPSQFEIDGKTVDAHATADLATYYLPPGIDLTYHWVVTMANGEIIETAARTVTWMDDRFDWEVTSFAGLELYSHDRSEDFLDYVRAVCEESANDLSDLYDLTGSEPVRIWLYDRAADLDAVQPANSIEWAAAYSYPDLRVTLAVIPEDSRSEVDRVLTHEISHHLLYQATQNPFLAPALWIDEGLAVLAQSGSHSRYRQRLEDAYVSGELISLRSLISSFPFDPAGARTAYAESFAVMEFIVETYGLDAISAIIAGYRDSLNHDAVLERALGLDTDDLEAAWIDSLGDQPEEQAA